MPENLQLTTREQWLAAVERLPAHKEPEHRRREDRSLPEFGIAALQYTPKSRRVERTGKILNASVGGLMLRVHEEIHDGIEVELQVAFEDEMFHLRGTVAHCTMSVGGYKVGIALEFSDVAPSNQQACANEDITGFHEEDDNHTLP